MKTFVSTTTTMLNGSIPATTSRQALGAWMLASLAACSPLAARDAALRGPDAPAVPAAAPAPDCTFTNPVAPGQDPWVIRHDGSYYLIEARNRVITVYKSDRLDAPKRNPVPVWTAPESGWNHQNVWAPELHRIDGTWYIYYSAGPVKGPPFNAQRAGVLEAASADPQGAYIDRGQLYTGDDLARRTESVWAIDFTVARIDGQLYAFWSGWERNAEADGRPQHLYAARMADPVTVATSRTRIASPTAAWEKEGTVPIQEGPAVLTRPDGRAFIVYSTRESWLPAYQLGWLRRRAPDAAPTDAASWIKSDGPVFEGAGDALGAGHASFTTSPDGSEDWIVYHSKSAVEPGWRDRTLRMQRFGWKADGSPDFGKPLPAGQPVAQPAGQCR